MEWGADDCKDGREGGIFEIEVIRREGKIDIQKNNRDNKGDYTETQKNKESHWKKI